MYTNQCADGLCPHGNKVCDFCASQTARRPEDGDMDGANLDASLSNLDFLWTDFESCSEDNLSPPRDPFRPENKIPLPEYEVAPLETFGLSELYSGVRRRNERERQRVRSVNEGFEKLRTMLPSDHFLQVTSQKRLSKVDVLKAAIQYIRHLQDLLQ